MKEIDNNIKESYVSYEVGKLLKNKGFNWVYDEFNPDCDGRYSYFQNINTKEIKMFSHYYIDTNHNGIPWICINTPAPTHALAIEWLRVNFGIWVEIHHINTHNINKFYLIIWKYGEEDYHSIYTEDSGYIVFESPQEATEAALKYVLEELI